MERTIIILSGGGPGPSPGGLPDADVVIAADSGLALADALGLVVDVVVGDLDSVLRRTSMLLGRPAPRLSPTRPTRTPRISTWR